jgi:hypothetical protein
VELCLHSPICHLGHAVVNPSLGDNQERTIRGGRFVCGSTKLSVNRDVEPGGTEKNRENPQ